MNVNAFLQKDYENEPSSVSKKQTQFKPNLVRRRRIAKMSLKSLAGKSAHTQKYPKSNCSLNSGLETLELSSMDNNKLTRREFIQYTAGSMVAMTGLLGYATEVNSKSKELPPVRAITHVPKFHWFSYYDKLQFDPSGRYVLGMEVDFEHRSPNPNDVISIGMVDLNDNDHWLKLGLSRSWCWQQGCMLQWLPGSKNEIIWNDRQDDRFVCHILNVFSGKKRTLPHPIYTISPDGRTAVAPDFRRIQDMRPGYGYAGLPDPHKDDLAPKDSGIFRIDLKTGPSRLGLAETGKMGTHSDCNYIFCPANLLILFFDACSHDLFFND